MVVGVVLLWPSGPVPQPVVVTAPRTSPSESTVPVVDGPLNVAEAKDIATDWFGLRDQARFDNNNGQLRALETGSALQVDLGFTRGIVCGCDPPKHQHILGAVHVVVPGPHADEFLAQFSTVTTDNQPVDYSVVLRRNSLDWVAPLVVLNNQRVSIRAGAHQPSRTAASGRGVLNATASYLTRWRTSGHRPPSPFDWTGLAAPLGAQWAKTGESTVDPETGVERRFSAAKVDPGAWAFPVVGGTLTCGSLALGDTATGRGGGLLFQDSMRHNWGTTLAPGSYPRLREASTLETCVISRPGGVRDLISTYGVQTDVTPGPSRPASSAAAVRPAPSANEA